MNGTNSRDADAARHAGLFFGCHSTTCLVPDNIKQYRDVCLPAFVSQWCSGKELCSFPTPLFPFATLIPLHSLPVTFLYLSMDMCLFDCIVLRCCHYGVIKHDNDDDDDDFPLSSESMCFSSDLFI